jgi:hypothetical protein
MRFGLCNAPSNFKSLMDHIFQPLLCHFILVLSDDILVYATHVVDVDHVLQLLCHHNLFINYSKFDFGASKVEYLGHIFNGEGVCVDPKKIEVMKY